MPIARRIKIAGISASREASFVAAASCCRGLGGWKPPLLAHFGRGLVTAGSLPLKSDAVLAWSGTRPPQADAGPPAPGGGPALAPRACPTLLDYLICPTTTHALCPPKPKLLL